MNEVVDTYDDKLRLKDALIGSEPFESSLLDELGMDFKAIYRESMLPVRMLLNKSVHPVNDICGPIVLLVIFTIFSVLQGKLHFEYIYLITIVSSVQNYLFLNLVSMEKKIDFIRCCGVLGYSFSPVVIFVIISPVLKYMGEIILMGTGGLLGLWSAYTATNVFCRLMDIEKKTYVVGYPLLICYLSFIIMVLL